MYGFLYRDLRFMRVMLIASGVVYFYTILIPIFGALNWSAEELNDIMEYNLRCLLAYSMNMVLSYFMQGELHKGDEKRLPVYFAIASPAGLNVYVKSKYISTLLVPFAAMNICLLTDLTANAILDLRSDVVQPPSFMGIYTSMFMLIILLSAIELPFMMRFGVKKGGNLKAGVFLALIAIVGIYFLFGDISMFGSWEDFIQFLIDVMNGKRGGSTLAAISALSPLVTGMLYFLSYKLSCKLYLKGVEQLDQ